MNETSKKVIVPFKLSIAMWTIKVRSYYLNNPLRLLLQSSPVIHQQKLQSMKWQEKRKCQKSRDCTLIKRQGSQSFTFRSLLLYLPKATILLWHSFYLRLTHDHRSKKDCFQVQTEGCKPNTYIQQIPFSESEHKPICIAQYVDVSIQEGLQQPTMYFIFWIRR